MYVWPNPALFQKQTIERLLKNSCDDISLNSEEVVHIYIETLRILLTEMRETLQPATIERAVEFTLRRLQHKKSTSPVTQTITSKRA